MIKIVTAAVIALLSPVGAIAAPFCLTLPTGTPQCIYYDGQECSRDANRQNGSCQVNPTEIRMPTSSVNQYCVVMPDGATTCGYSDGTLCSQEALRQKGACERSRGAAPRSLPDAFEPNAGR